MLVAKIICVLFIASTVYGLPAAKEGSKKCPNGFQYVNGVTKNVMYDDRDIRTCDNDDSSACIIIKYDYKTPEALVHAEWNLPCYNPRKLPSFNLNTLFPEAALPLDINLDVCMDEDCVTFTPAAPEDLYCDRGVVVTDLDSGNELVREVSRTQCKAHQTGCYTMTQTFVQDGKSAQRVVGDCYDEWRSYNFIWDRFYPYTDFTGGFCEKHGCIAFKVWHKDSFDTRTCYCTGNNKPPGTYSAPEVTSCNGDMCNTM